MLHADADAGLQCTGRGCVQFGAHLPAALDPVVHHKRGGLHLRQFDAAAWRRLAIDQLQVGRQHPRAVQLQPVRCVKQLRHPGQRREVPFADQVAGSTRYQRMQVGLQRDLRALQAQLGIELQHAILAPGQLRAQRDALVHAHFHLQGVVQRGTANARALQWRAPGHAATWLYLAVAHHQPCLQLAASRNQLDIEPPLRVGADPQRGAFRVHVDLAIGQQQLLQAHGLLAAVAPDGEVAAQAAAFEHLLAVGQHPRPVEMEAGRKDLHRPAAQLLGKPERSAAVAFQHYLVHVAATQAVTDDALEHHRPATLARRRWLAVALGMARTSADPGGHHLGNADFLAQQRQQRQPATGAIGLHFPPDLPVLALQAHVARHHVAGEQGIGRAPLHLERIRPLVGHRLEQGVEEDIAQHQIGQVGDQQRPHRPPQPARPASPEAQPPRPPGPWATRSLRLCIHGAQHA